MAIYGSDSVTETSWEALYWRIYVLNHHNSTYNEDNVQMYYWHESKPQNLSIDLSRFLYVYNDPTRRSAYACGLNLVMPCSANVLWWRLETVLFRGHWSQRSKRCCFKLTQANMLSTLVIFLWVGVSSCKCVCMLRVLHHVHTINVDSDVHELPSDS